MPKVPKCTVCAGQHYAAFYHRKPIARIGKKGKEINAAVAEWKKTIKPNHQGYYECYICGKYVDYLVAEHVKSKVRHPELRSDSNNFRPVCNECNQIKGSKDILLA